MITDKFKDSVPVTTFMAAVGYLKNKAIAIALLAGGIKLYNSIPQGSDAASVPFAEVLYASILLGAIMVLAPFARLLAFPEAADYAESGRLREDLASAASTPALAHYRFSTGVCYVATIICIGTIVK